MSDKLEVYEGSWARLRNGEVVGPIRKTRNRPATWPYYTVDKDGYVAYCWNDDGQCVHGSTKDIVELRPFDTRSPIPADAPATQDTIPESVLKAAMDAGLKAEPAYENFVRAIITASIAAAPADWRPSFVVDDSSRSGNPPDFDFDGLCDVISRALSVSGGMSFADRTSTAKELLSRAASQARDFIDRQRHPQNESENRIGKPEDPEGGLSGYTDAEINEIWTAWASGCHPAAEPRWTYNRKAREGLCQDEGCPHHGTPHICLNLTDEQQRLLMKIGKNMEYGSLRSPHIPTKTEIKFVEPPTTCDLVRYMEKLQADISKTVGISFDNYETTLDCLYPYQQDLLDRLMAPEVKGVKHGETMVPVEAFRDLDKIHPTTRAFLELLYPHAPLRAVEMHNDYSVIADFGRPGQPAAIIEFNIIDSIDEGQPAFTFPLWIEDRA